MAKPVGYVAGPYTKGDPGLNVHYHCMVFELLLHDGKVTPYMPLWSHAQHTTFPRHYHDWITYDNEMIAALPIEWILRTNVDFDFENGARYFMQESSGADAEVELVKKLYPDAVVVVQKEFEELHDAVARLYEELGKKAEQGNG